MGSQQELCCILHGRHIQVASRRSPAEIPFKHWYFRVMRAAHQQTINVGSRQCREACVEATGHSIGIQNADWLRLQVVIKRIDELFLTKSWLPRCPLDVKVSRVAERMDTSICSAGDAELDGNNGF